MVINGLLGSITIGGGLVLYGLILRSIKQDKLFIGEIERAEIRLKSLKAEVVKAGMEQEALIQRSIAYDPTRLVQTKALPEGNPPTVRGQTAAINLLDEAAFPPIQLRSERGKSDHSPCHVEIDYTNHRGERGLRRIKPIQLQKGPMAGGESHYWHSEATWILRARDCDKGACRDFDMSKIHSWRDIPVQEVSEVVNRDDANATRLPELEERPAT